MEQSAYLYHISWFNKNTGKVDDKNIDTNELETLHSDVLQLYKVRKQLKIIDKKVTKEAKLVYLMEDEFETNPIIGLSSRPCTGIRPYSQYMHTNTGECYKQCNRDNRCSTGWVGVWIKPDRKISQNTVDPFTSNKSQWKLILKKFDHVNSGI